MVEKIAVVASIRELIREDWDQLCVVSQVDRKLRPWNLISPRFMHIVVIRMILHLNAKKFYFVAKVFSLSLYFLFRIELNSNACIGGGLVIPHPNGIVIGAHKIGKRALIYQNVTLGSKHLDVKYTPDKRPILGEDVIVGSGAVVVGGVVLGDGVTVAANSLVLQDMPDGSFGIGVPAKVKHSHDTRSS